MSLGQLGIAASTPTMRLCVLILSLCSVSRAYWPFQKIFGISSHGSTPESSANILTPKVVADVQKVIKDAGIPGLALAAVRRGAETEYAILVCVAKTTKR